MICIILTCRLSLSPTPVIEWGKIDGKLPTRTNIKNYGKWLIITKVTEEDSGKYMCKAKNSAGEAVHFFDITVEGMKLFINEMDLHSAYVLLMNKNISLILLIIILHVLYI